MVDSRSDDELRRIVFGRGHSADEVADASAELRRRSAGRVPDATPGTRDDPVLEASGSEDLSHESFDEGLDDGEAAGSHDAHRGGRGNGPRTTAVVAVIVAVIALAGGWLAGNASAGSGSTATPAASPTPAIGAGERASVVDPDTGVTVYEVPAGRPDYLSQASSSRLPEATEADPAATRLPAVFDNVDTATARYVGRIGDLRGAWTARNSSGEYCVVIAINDSGAYGSSCVSVGAFAERGVSIGSGRYSLLWNSASAILSMTAD